MMLGQEKQAGAAYADSSQHDKWHCIFKEWERSFTARGGDPKNIFIVRKIYDPKQRLDWCGGKLLHWVEVDNVETHHQNVQRWLEGRNFGIFSLPERSGLWTTIDLLWKVRHCPESAAAVLIGASLFEAIDQPRHRYVKGYWPSGRILESIMRLALDALGKDYRPWHHACTQTLPDHNNWRERDMRQIEDVIDLFAHDHVLSLVSKYRPVALEFVDSREETGIASVLDRQYQEDHEADMRWREEWAQQDRQRMLLEQERTRCHPRWREWRGLSPQDLEALVWSFPAVELAKEFGVSDVAIAKRCKKHNIAKPPRGFWAMVKAGRMPHPQGKPPKARRARL